MDCRLVPSSIDRSEGVCRVEAAVDRVSRRRPFDPDKPAVTSGIRLGTSAGPRRGFGTGAFKRIGARILDVVEATASAGPEGDGAVGARVCQEVMQLTGCFPIYR